MNINNVKEIQKCICCGSDNINLLLDLNVQPLANSYHNNTQKLEEYPLGVNLCNECFHIQLTHAVNPDLLFKDYLYVSGTAQTMLDSFEWFADFVLEYNPKTKNVLDIACNDGSQLDCFKSRKIDTWGVDPAENLYEDCKGKGHNVICDYFDKKTFTDKKFDNIVAQNVFAHNLDSKKFLDDCYEIMHDDSYLFIQTSQAEMVLNNQFDTIYHEHISFFNVNSFNELVKRTKLNLIDVVKQPIHGISYIFVLSKKDLNKHRVENIINVEKLRGLQTKKTYDDYREKVYDIANGFKEALERSRELGYKIVGYGAAAKGMTFLNFTDEQLDYIVDDNPLKQNLYTPGTNIKIKSAESLKKHSNDDKILFVPLAWNFYDEIKSRILKVRDNENDRFLRYFPDIKVEN